MTASTLWIVNLTTLVTDVQARTMAAALNTQLAHDVGPAWKVQPPIVQFSPVKTTPQSGASWIALVDDDSQLQGALGAHWETGDGAPIGEVLCSIILAPTDRGGAGGAVLTGPDSVLSVLSHEGIELTIDPTVNMWCDAPDGYEYRREAADPVEADVYTLPGSDLTLSNFVTPAWFDDSPRAGTRTDWLNRLGGKPFAIGAGGYAERRTSSSDEGQVTARKRERVYGPSKAKTRKASGYAQWREDMRSSLRCLRYSHAARNFAA
jgi:hypothetical protein